MLISPSTRDLLLLLLKRLLLLSTTGKSLELMKLTSIVTSSLRMRRSWGRMEKKEDSEVRIDNIFLLQIREALLLLLFFLLLQLHPSSILRLLFFLLRLRLLFSLLIISNFLPLPPLSLLTLHSTEMALHHLLLSFLLLCCLHHRLPFLLHLHLSREAISLPLCIVRRLTKSIAIQLLFLVILVSTITTRQESLYGQAEEMKKKENKRGRSTTECSLEKMN